MAYFGYNRSLPGRPSSFPGAWRCSISWVLVAILGPGSTMLRLTLLVQGVPTGWNEQGNPGSGRGIGLTAGGTGGKPTAEPYGLSQGKLHGKLEGSFMSIQRASISTPLDGEKNVANSLFQ
jgi:hypothetical protein